jgi:hypothetical protein
MLVKTAPLYPGYRRSLRMRIRRLGQFSASADGQLRVSVNTATGARVGGALQGTKGDPIGAAIGGGGASIYEAARRR